jgi:hypothetical protein
MVLASPRPRLFAAVFGCSLLNVLVGVVVDLGAVIVLVVIILHLSTDR